MANHDSETALGGSPGPFRRLAGTLSPEPKETPWRPLQSQRKAYGDARRSGIWKSLCVDGSNQRVEYTLIQDSRITIRTALRPRHHRVVPARPAIPDFQATHRASRPNPGPERKP